MSQRLGVNAGIGKPGAAPTDQNASASHRDQAVDLEPLGALSREALLVEIEAVEIADQIRRDAVVANKPANVVRFAHFDGLYRLPVGGN